MGNIHRMCGWADIFIFLSCENVKANIMDLKQKKTGYKISIIILAGNHEQTHKSIFVH
jgi:hypothetical protein